MLLLNVKATKQGTFLEVQSGDKAYRSENLSNELMVNHFVKEVVMGMLAKAAAPDISLSQMIPAPTELKKSLKDGIGMSDDHRRVVILKDGKEIILDEGPRYMVSDTLKIRVFKAIQSGNAMKGEW